ncbi:TIGR03086 family protein [Ornithinimicrobium sp. Arc0846-15]|nr:TIGR03086 family protein [Ornithinimicrobium laminariae]
MGRVTEIEPGRRFSYTHGWVGDQELPPGSSEVTVTLEPIKDGTSVTVRHHGLPEGAAEGMQAGWDDFMGRLARSATGGSNARDWPAEQELTDPAAVLDSALFTLLAALRDVTHDAWSRQTPCEGFTVGELAQHLIDNATMLGQVLDCAAPEASTGKGLEDDVAVALWPCVEAAEVLPPDIDIDFGEATITAEGLVKYLSVEFLVHAWDIGQAIGENLDVSTELIETILGHAEHTKSTLFFTPETFHPSTPTAVDVDPLTRLLAFTGRATSSR